MIFIGGSFIGLIFSGIAAITISIVMLRGAIFAKATAWIGIVGFTFLSLLYYLIHVRPFALYLSILCVRADRRLARTVVVSPRRT